jgi:hypothetical protein
VPATRPGGAARGRRVTAVDPAYRCAAASVLRDDPLAGTASTVRAFLLLEHPGSWGVDALRDARLPQGLGPELRDAAAAAGVRVLLVRRPGRPAERERRVFAAFADPHAPFLEAGSVTDLREVLDLDLTALRAGRSSGLDRHEGSVFCVCTHGRHDACCAERGRPVAAALALARPDEAWEVSHIGGDRYAGNMLVLPHGLYYGRLDPRAAIAVAAAHTSGQLDLNHLRGRSGLPMAVQAAEIGLRRELGETRTDAVRFTRRRAVADSIEAEIEVAGSSYVVTVRSSASADGHRLTCRATRENPLPSHEVTLVRRAP